MEFSLAGGGSAELESYADERVVLLATVARPPGSTLQMTLGDESESYEVKVRGCRRSEDGRFRIEGRLINLTRSARARLDG